jgi:hypothetical protein
MRVELIYAPGCSSYKKFLDKLETVIAEERLPIPVHVIESTSSCDDKVSPTLKIDGDEINALPVPPAGEACRLYHTSSGTAAMPCIDSLRDILHRRWKDLTEKPLLGS